MRAIIAQLGHQPGSESGGPRARVSARRTTRDCDGSIALSRIPATTDGGGIWNKIGVSDVAAIAAAQHKMQPSWSYLTGTQG